MYTIKTVNHFFFSNELIWAMRVAKEKEDAKKDFESRKIFLRVGTCYESFLYLL
jgi:hypothetical protein